MARAKHKKRPPSIQGVAEALEIAAVPEAMERLDLYAREVIRWGRRINLTGADDLDSFVAGPLFDALTLIPVLAPLGSLVDVGSGAGLPGIPAAMLAPGVKVTLVEPRLKRTTFLAHVTQQLDLDLEIAGVRAEQLGGRLWTGAVAQAVWPPDQWLPRGLELVEPDGFVYAMTSTPIQAGQIPAGLRVDLEKRYHRPAGRALRVSTRLRKTGDPKKDPRK